MYPNKFDLLDKMMSQHCLIAIVQMKLVAETLEQ